MISRGESGDVSAMDCNELVELVTDYFDDLMDPRARARFDLHLAECDGCENYLQQFRSTISILGHGRPRDFDPIFRKRLADALRHRR